MDDLIYGKQHYIKKIVSIEPCNDTVEVFFEESPSIITSQFFPHKYWILASTKLSENFQRLKGDLHYKWGRLYNDKEDFLKGRNYYKYKDSFSIFNPKESCAVRQGFSCFLDMKPEDVSLVSFDLETTGLDPNAPDAKILLISSTYRAGQILEKRLFCYNDYPSQKELINDWCIWIRKVNPTLLIGHNIFGFDLPYLQSIANREGGSLSLGRDNSNATSEDYERKFRVDGNRDLGYHDCRIYGREIIDTYFLAIKSDIGRKYNSYGLKPIIAQEGWELPGRVFYDSSLIRNNYQIPEEWEKIKQYCIDDSLDAITLYDKFVPPFFYMCQNVAKGSFQTLGQSASGSQLNSILCRAYLQNAHSLPKAEDSIPFQGAYSLGVPGYYKNCIRWDVVSLYPTLMVQYKIQNLEKDPQGYMLKMLEYFLADRLKNKALAKQTNNNYYKHLEQTAKIFLNSTYGFLGSKGLLFNSPQDAAKVTRKGRETLDKAIIWATGKNYDQWNIQNKE